MQIEMVNIYENEKFTLYGGVGSKNTGLLAFQPDDGTGNATNDTFTVSSAECRVSDFSGKSRMYAPWEDIGKRNTRPGTVSLIWDESCLHWCACDNERARRPKYTLTGKVYTPKEMETIIVPVKAGDTLVVVRGEVVIDDDRQVKNLFATEISKSRKHTVLAATDSVIFVITPQLTG